MSAQDEIAKIIESVDSAAGWDVSPDSYDMYADAILAAGYSKPRTITTVEELDALPDGSVVLNAKDNVCELFTVEFPGEDPDRAYSTPGIAEDWPIGRLALPATVLFTPKES